MTSILSKKKKKPSNCSWIMLLCFPYESWVGVSSLWIKTCFSDLFICLYRKICFYHMQLALVIVHFPHVTRLNPKSIHCTVLCHEAVCSMSPQLTLFSWPIPPGPTTCRAVSTLLVAYNQLCPLQLSLA